MSTTEVAVTTKKDWASDQEVRWCPGCGDYTHPRSRCSRLPGRRSSMEREKHGIHLGDRLLVSRFPYYMNTYGMHSIHGRAPAIATGFARRPTRT